MCRAHARAGVNAGTAEQQQPLADELTELICVRHAEYKKELSKSNAERVVFSALHI
jgi:hypothetical protein